TKAQSLTADLRIEGERVSLEDNSRALFNKYPKGKQTKRALPSPVVYDIKGDLKSTTREKVALEREVERIVQLPKIKFSRKDIMKNNQSSTVIPLPKGLNAKQVTGHFNPLPDGNCEHRVTAYTVSEDKHIYGKVKNEMLTCLKKNEHLCHQVFDSSLLPTFIVLSDTYKDVYNKFNNDASNGTIDNWFQFT
ncbi:hypothetical protein A0J61_10724, partial [Choanephora cucurbitarum]